MKKQTASAIKKAINKGDLTQKQIAEKYGVSRSLVSDIATGRVHTDVNPQITKVKMSGGQTKEYDVDDHIISLMGQVENLRLERNDLRRQVRKASKTQNIFEAVAEEVSGYTKALVPKGKVYTPKRSADVEESLVLHLSDGHHDQIVLPEEVNGLENHNFLVSTRRAEVLVDSVIKFSQHTLCNFHFRELWILAYGDHTCGEIHDAEKKSHFRNQFKNALAIGQLHALMFRDFAPHFEKINILYLPGNHGRRTTKKEYADGAHNNWDYLIGKLAEDYCRDLDNVEFHIPNAFSAIVDINGFNFHVSHGDDISGTQGQPWTGLRKRHERMSPIHHNQIDYYACGHWHTRGDVEGNGTEFLTNGNWLVTDGYAYNKMGVAGKPTQLLHGVHEKRGVSWRLPIQLRTEDELDGPQYYDVPLLEA